MKSKVLNKSTARAFSFGISAAGRFLKILICAACCPLFMLLIFQGALSAKPFAGDIENIDSVEITVLIDEKAFSADFSIDKSASGARIFNSKDITLLKAPGRLETVRAVDGTFLVNRLSVADYIAGVVFSEAAGGRPEFLSALAVLIRTMVYKEIRTRSAGLDGRHACDAPYLLCSRTHCASFRGSPPVFQYNSVRAAVERTRNETLKYRGSPVDVYFSASCGGFRHTPSELYGGSDEAYFFKIPERTCPCSILNKRKWAAVFPAAGLKRIFGFQVFSLEKTEGSAVIVNNKIRLSFDSFMKAIERSKFGRVKSPDFNIRHDEKTDSYILDGTGVGHGIGLCDDGAEVLAASGMSYREILRFYYNGCSTGSAFQTSGRD